MGKENTEKRYDKDGIEMVVEKKEYIGNACGAIGTNCIQQIVQNKTYFYTDKIGISPVVVGMASSIATIIDALSDVVRCVYKRHSTDSASIAVYRND